MSATTANGISSSSSSSSVVTSGQIPNGVPRMSPLVGMGLALLTAIYFSLTVTYGDSKSPILGFLPPPAKEFCNDRNDDENCVRADLFAFQIASGVAILACGIMGFHGWHITKRVHTVLPQTPAGRLFGYLPESELLASINFTFQFWDFWISLLIPEHCTAVMICHHIAAATVSYLAVRYTVLHYYAIFFVGCSEFSSIFLVLVDLAKFFPPVPGSIYDKLVGIAGPLFVLGFIYYRVILWWPVSLRLFRDVYEVKKSGQVDKLRPGCSWVLYVYLVLNIPLGFLQLYWLTIILQEVQKAVADFA